MSQQTKPVKQTIARTIILSGAAAMLGIGVYFGLFRIRRHTIYHAWPWLASHNAGLVAFVGFMEIVAGMGVILAIGCGIFKLFEMAEWA